MRAEPHRTARYPIGLRPLVWVWTPAVLLLAGIATRDRATSEELLRDPAQVTGSSASTGLVSNLGMLGWGAAAAALLGAGYLLHRLHAPGDRIAWLVSAGLFTFVLLIDDFFLVHERTLDDRVGIPQHFTFAIYGLAVVAWAVVFRNHLRATPLVLPAVALVGFVVSIVVDLGDSARWWEPLVEDGSKFLGILAWAVYAVQLSRDLVLEAAEQPGAEPGSPPVG